MHIHHSFRSLFIFSVLCIFASICHGFEALGNNGVEEQELNIEPRFAEAYHSEIAPYFSRGKKGTFEGKNGIEISYVKFPAPLDTPKKGTIVISSGRTESYIKYAEVIYNFGKQGYSVYMHDHRGQGFSGRIVPEDTQMAHVEDFEFYVDDLEKFMKHVVVPEAGNKIFLIGHSMGGAIAVRYAERQPQEVAALALVSPMLDPYLPVDRFDATRIVCLFTAVSSLFWPNEYISGAHSYDRTPISFENNDLTHSKPRFEKMHQILNEEGNDIAKLGGPSRKWVREACKGSARAIDAATEIKVPVLLLQAGDDTAVHNEAQEKFCVFLNTGAFGEQCKGFTVLGARHAIFIEADEYRTPAMLKMFDFFSSLQR